MATPLGEVAAKHCPVTQGVISVAGFAYIFFMSWFLLDYLMMNFCPLMI